MRAQAGDLIRDRWEGGPLLRVQMVEGGGYWATRLRDGVRIFVDQENVERVVSPSGFPGDPEVTEKGPET